MLKSLMYVCLIHRIPLRTVIDNIQYFIILRTLHERFSCHAWKDCRKGIRLEICPSHEHCSIDAELSVHTAFVGERSVCFLPVRMARGKADR